ncbi:hypothetical protein [Ferrimonas futtsuensis]|uniref:hypothetical protein n=1 Tax=Ferrimonas futtsuensis TaxID=364764 RepID=UPI000482A656|nr:hypothetical protein [Ferrimonas futtsuensis]
MSLLIGGLAASVVALLVLFLFSSATTSTFTEYMDIANAFVLTEGKTLDSSDQARVIGEMVQEGTLISLRDLWGFESSFYQTIVTLLIAVNGLVAAFTFVVVN